MADHPTEGIHVEKVTLYSYYQSSCAWRVRLAMELKGIPFEYKAINLATGEHLSEEYRKLSPLQLVPVLVVEGNVLADSIAILEYLEEKFPDKRPLLPKGLVQRATIRQVVNLIASNVQPIQNLRVLNAIRDKLGSEERLKWAQDCINRGFEALELILKKTAGKYTFGDEITLADVVLVPQLGNAKRFQVDLTRYPILDRIGKELLELPEVQKSLPANQPDAPK